MREHAHPVIGEARDQADGARPAYYNTELDLPYWNVNTPLDQRTEDCPPFLTHLSDKDKRQLSTPDAQYKRLSWPEVKAIVDENRLQDFTRLPSDLRRYRAFVSEITEEFGGVARYVLTDRLRWEEPVEARGQPFEHAEDWKILKNDWPYGLDERIVHLVVWTKFELVDDPASGQPTNATKQGIEQFMADTFYNRISREQVSYRNHSFSAGGGGQADKRRSFGSRIGALSSRFML